MTPRIFTAALTLSTIAFLSCDPPEKEVEEAEILIEASVIAGQPVSNIRVVRIDQPSDRGAQSLVPDAKVKMLSMGKVYELKPIQGRLGYYHYAGKDLEIVEGREYFLWVEYDDQVAVTARVVGEAIPGAEINADSSAENYVAKN